MTVDAVEALHHGHLGTEESGRSRDRSGCVVERFKQESMTGLFNKEVAVVNSWPLV